MSKGAIHGAVHRLHEKAWRNPAFQRLAVISRILLAVVFVPTGMVKLLGERFTAMGIDNPVGFFFEGLYGGQCCWPRSFCCAGTMTG